MLTMKHGHMWDMKLKFLLTVNRRVLIAKEAPTTVTAFISQSIKHVRFHITKLLYGIFRYCKVCLAFKRRVDIALVSLGKEDNTVIQLVNGNASYSVHMYCISCMPMHYTDSVQRAFSSFVIWA